MLSPNRKCCPSLIISFLFTTISLSQHGKLSYQNFYFLQLSSFAVFAKKIAKKESKTSKSWNRVWRKLLRKDTQSNFSNRMSLSSSPPELFSQFLWSSNIKEKYMGLVWCAINKLEQVSYEMFCRKSIENASKEK